MFVSISQYLQGCTQVYNCCSLLQPAKAQQGHLKKLMYPHNIPLSGRLHVLNKCITLADETWPSQDKPWLKPGHGPTELLAALEPKKQQRNSSQAKRRQHE
jgi:hypothetical protein